MKDKMEDKMEDYKKKWLEEQLKARAMEAQALQLRLAMLDMEAGKIKEYLAAYNAEQGSRQKGNKNVENTEKSN